MAALLVSVSRESIFAPSEVLRIQFSNSPELLFGRLMPFLRGGLGLLEDDGHVGLGRLDLTSIV